MLDELIAKQRRSTLINKVPWNCPVLSHKVFIPFKAKPSSLLSESYTKNLLSLFFSKLFELQNLKFFLCKKTLDYYKSNFQILHFEQTDQ